MKKVVLLSIGLLTVILLSCSMLRVNALNSNEWTSSVAWDKGTYYQGDSGSVTPTFYSSCPDQLQISSVSIEFDWMTTPNTVTVSSPNIATGGQYTSSAISFSIPSGVSVGSHSYTITYKGQQKGLLGWYGISVSGTGSVSVHDAYELVYQQTISNIQNSLNNAQNSNYQSPNAQSLLQQANNMYNQATSLANQGQWQNAVNDLNTASSDLSQAQAAEQQYTTPTPTSPPSQISISNNTIIYIVVTVVVIIAVIGAVAGIVIKQKASKKPKPT